MERFASEKLAERWKFFFESVQIDDKNITYFENDKECESLYIEGLENLKRIRQMEEYVEVYFE